MVDVILAVVLAVAGVVAARLVLIPMIERSCADLVMDDETIEELNAEPGVPPGATVGPQAAIAIQAVTALLSASVALRFGFSPALVPYLIVAGLLVALSAVDLYQLRIPDRILFPGLGITALALIGASLLGEVKLSWIGAAIGAVAYSGVLAVTWLISPRGMGFGDVKLGLLLGMAVGWLYVPLVLFALGIGCAIGALVGGTLMILRRRNVAFPFGPSLAIGAVAVILASQPLVDWLQRGS
jgi:leader peptidase (prepilin peptidase)/N-methyltransferase